MRRDLLTSLIAVVFCTVVFGLAYPLAMTGVAQVLFPGNANGSKITEDGQVVGSKLIAQDFRKVVPTDAKHGTEVRAGPRSALLPAAAVADRTTARRVTFFSNLGPNRRRRRDEVEGEPRRLSEARGPYDPGLTAADVPVDAITQSASGVDPQISKANAEIQAHRIAAVRHLPLSAGAEPHRRQHRRALPRRLRRARRERARAQPRPRQGGPDQHDREARPPLPVRSASSSARRSSGRSPSSTRASRSATRSCSSSRSAPSSPPSPG